MSGKQNRKLAFALRYLVIAIGLFANDYTQAASKEVPPVDKTADQSFTEKIGVLFVPGIFGSKLKCLSEGDFKEKIIWGDGNYGGDGLSLIDCPNAEAILMDRAEITQMVGVIETAFSRLVGTFKDLNVYSDFKKSLNFSTDAKVRSFPYDWRKSNQFNASLMQEEICRLFSSSNLKKYIIVAHSMGGLVTDHWVKEKMVKGEKCPDGAPSPINNENLSSIIFGGTPFLGSPEVINSLFSGRNSFTRSASFRYLFGESLMIDSITFDSVYELLPFTSIVGSSCAGRANLTSPVVAKSTSGGATTNMNLSIIDNWHELSLPRGLPEERRRELQSLIGEKVEKASKVVCDRLSTALDIGIKSKYRYLIGKLRKENDFEKSTIVGGTISDTSEPAEFTPSLGLGDGTVPFWSAYNGKIDDSFRQDVAAVHDKIFDDTGVLSGLEEQLSALGTAISIENDLDTNERPSREEITGYVKKVGSIRNTYIDHNLYSDLTTKLAAAAERSNFGADILYQEYQGKGADDAERAFGLAVAAKMNSLNEAQDAVAWNKSAELNFRLNNPGIAWRLAQDGTSVVDANSTEDFAKRAYFQMESISGKSRLYMGDYGGFDDLNLAATKGSKEAKRHIPQFENQIGRDIVIDPSSIIGQGRPM